MYRIIYEWIIGYVVKPRISVTMAGNFIKSIYTRSSVAIRDDSNKVRSMVQLEAKGIKYSQWFKHYQNKKWKKKIKKKIINIRLNLDN